MVEETLKGLKALPLKFPRKCHTCGQEYASETDFLEKTKSLRAGRSSLKEGEDDDGHAIVEVYRNCICGSTMMDEFHSRRDMSPEGIRRREEYDRLIASGKTREEIIQLFRSTDSAV